MEKKIIYNSIINVIWRLELRSSQWISQQVRKGEPPASHPHKSCIKPKYFHQHTGFDTIWQLPHLMRTWGFCVQQFNSVLLHFVGISSGLSCYSPSWHLRIHKELRNNTGGSEAPLFAHQKGILAAVMFSTLPRMGVGFSLHMILSQLTRPICQPFMHQEGILTEIQFLLCPGQGWLLVYPRFHPNMTAHLPNIFCIMLCTA